MNPILLLGLLGAGAATVMAVNKPKIKRDSGSALISQWQVIGKCQSVIPNPKANPTTAAFKFWIEEYTSTMSVLRKKLFTNILDAASDLYTLKYYESVCHKLQTEASAFLYMYELYLATNCLMILKRIPKDAYQEAVLNTYPAYAKNTFGINISGVPENTDLDEVTDKEIVEALYTEMLITTQMLTNGTSQNRQNSPIYQTETGLLGLALYVTQFLKPISGIEFEFYFGDMTLNSSTNAKRLYTLQRCADTAKKLAYILPFNKKIYDDENDTLADENKYDQFMNDYFTEQGYIKK